MVQDEKLGISNPHRNNAKSDKSLGFDLFIGIPVLARFNAMVLLPVLDGLESPLSLCLSSALTFTKFLQHQMRKNSKMLGIEPRQARWEA